MADTIYDLYKERSVSGLTVIGTTTIKALILKTTAAGAFAKSIATVTALLAVGTVAEAAFTNYSRKTVVLTSALNGGADRAEISTPSVTWTALGVAGGGDGSVVAIVFYDEGGGTDATRIPIAYYDTGLGVITNGGDFTINAGVIATLT